MANLNEKLSNLLDGVINVDGKDVELAEALLKALLAKALRGDIKAISLVLDRVLGKTPQDINIGGQDGKPLINSAVAIQHINDRITELAGVGKDTVSAIPPEN